MPEDVLDLTMVVTSYNHQAYVEQCLDSIAAQSAMPRQVVVVDDCSTDDSVAVIAAWLEASGLAWTFLPHERNQGVCAAMNESLGIAEGRFLCHLSADDWIEPTRLERQAAALARYDDDIAFLAGDIREVDAGGLTLAVHDIGERLDGLTGAGRRRELHLALLERNLLPAPGILLRTQSVREVGGWDEDLLFEDYDMWLRLSLDNGIEYAPGIVTNYRFLGSGLTRSPHRQVAFLGTERRCLEKQQGRDPAADAVIRRRIAQIDEVVSGLAAHADVEQ